MASDKHLYCSIAGVTNVQSVTTEESYSQISASATIECTSTTLDLSNAISIDLGYTDNHAQIFSGFVKKIEYQRPDGLVKITANDTLVRAVDYFMASDDPEAPFQVENTGAYATVQQLLAEAGITNVTGSEPGFTFGTNGPAKFNLQTVADAVNFIAQVTGYTIWADDAGLVHFAARKPYPVGGDVSSGTLTTGDGKQILDITYEKSSIPIRNVIKIYGKSPIVSKASATSPYVVVDQTSVIAHELIDDQALADATASVNLDLLNHLGQTITLTVEGNPAYRARGIWHITESFSGLNTDVFFYRVNTNWSQAGMTQNITAIPTPAPN